MRFAVGPCAALAVGLVLACGNPLREDELECEEAVAVLATCCPGFDYAKAVGCQYIDRGCDGASYPGLPIGDARCIRGESCRQIVTSGVCDRAQRAGEITVTSGDYRSEPASRGVCP